MFLYLLQVQEFKSTIGTTYSKISFSFNIPLLNFLPSVQLLFAAVAASVGFFPLVKILLRTNKLSCGLVSIGCCCYYEAGGCAKEKTSFGSGLICRCLQNFILGCSKQFQ